MSHFFRSFRRKRSLVIIFCFISFCLLAVAFLFLQSDKGESLVSGFVKEQKPERTVSIGAWVGGFWDVNSKTLHLEKILEMEKAVGKEFAIAHFFRGWGDASNQSFVTDVNTILDSGRTPMVSINPYFFSECESEETLYKAIAIGDCDVYLQKMAVNLSQIKREYFFRFAWEMNVETIEWSLNLTGSTPHEYKDAWRRIHRIMKENGATSAVWVFAPQVDTPSTLDFYTVYPGDEYVDWVGLDGYNWGATKDWSSWQTFEQVFDASIKRMSALAPSKKFMIAEVNSAPIGGERSIWLKEMLEVAIPEMYPQIDALVFFSEDKEAIEGVNWSFLDDKKSLRQLRKSLNKPIYTSSLDI